MNRSRKELIVLKVKGKDYMESGCFMFFRFHKIMRKRKEKLEAKRAVENETNLLEKADKLRAKERATLKHSRMSKWAKEQLTRNHKDPSVHCES